jgi:hypothetical protein
VTISETIDRLVAQYGQSNADDLSKGYAVRNDTIGFPSFWCTSGYSDARTQGMTRSANIAGTMFSKAAFFSLFYGPRDRDEAIAMLDRIVPLNLKARAELIQLRAIVGSPEDVEVAA